MRCFPFFCPAPCAFFPPRVAGLVVFAAFFLCVPFTGDFDFAEADVAAAFLVAPFFSATLLAMNMV
jgi:hypothetical protein